MYKLIIALLLVFTVSCSMLAPMLMDSLSPSKGGINTELVVGDKEQVLGSNQDVKASTVGKVVGMNDNSTTLASAQEVEINNTNIPVGLFVGLVGFAFLGWMTPRPITMWKNWKAYRNRHDN